MVMQSRTRIRITGVTTMNTDPFSLTFPGQCFFKRQDHFMTYVLTQAFSLILIFAVYMLIKMFFLARAGPLLIPH
jgi:hypothetical protein